MTDERIVNPEQTNDEAAFEANIRPRRLDEYVGQARVKENLSVFIRAAQERGEALDHVLWSARAIWLPSSQILMKRVSFLSMRFIV